ncbi:Unknown protein [Striga hermonthica]|uniref:Uncharacterized protein n=1 Tax=Striga hermonthica TaxID=68872 RepID=A0A9N7RH19_STRHE|nr:Unknown protein [Striga hermonthica]
MNTKTLARANREKYLAGIGGRYYPTWHRRPSLTRVKSASKVEPLASVSFFSRGFFSFFFLSFSPDFFVSFFSFSIQISAVTRFDMLRVEGDFRPEALRRPLPSEADVACDRELTRSRSDASSLTADDRKAVFRSSEDVAPQDDGTAWTDEKHNLYLHDLEVSFAEQLYHSKALLSQCSEQNLRDVNISKKRLADVKNASEQFKKPLQNSCLQKISYVKGGPLFGSSTTDLSTPFTSTRGYNLKNNCYLPSAEWAASREVWSALKHVKGTISHRLGTCSQEYSSSDPYLGDSFDLQREGTGQNFPDEGTSNFEPQAKRSKNAVAESSLQDQIVPSSKCPTANYPDTDGL